MVFIKKYENKEEDTQVISHRIFNIKRDILDANSVTGEKTRTDWINQFIDEGIKKHKLKKKGKQKWIQLYIAQGKNNGMRF